MKQMDVRNIKALMEIMGEDEEFTAREAMDRLVTYRQDTGGSLMFVPNVNRMSYILKRSDAFAIAPKRNPSAPNTFVRVG